MNYHKLMQPPLLVPAAFIAICGGEGTVAMLLSYLYGRCAEQPTPISYDELREAIHLTYPAINRARGLLKRAGYLAEEWGRQQAGKFVVYEVLYDAVDAEITKWLTDDNYEHQPLTTQGEIK